MGKSFNSVISPDMAKKRDIVLFCIACAILAVTLAVTLVLFNSLAIAYFMVLVFLAVGSDLVVGIAFFWIFGLVDTAVLAFKKGDRPRWLRIASLILMVIYLALVVCLLLALIDYFK